MKPLALFKETFAKIPLRSTKLTANLQAARETVRSAGQTINNSVRTGLAWVKTNALYAVSAILILAAATVLVLNNAVFEEPPGVQVEQTTPPGLTYPQIDASPAGSSTAPIAPPNPVQPSPAAAPAPEISGIPHPAEGEITRPFGFTWSETYQDYRYHQGVDILTGPEAQVTLPLSGQITKIEETPLWGCRVEVIHPGGWTTIYSHLESVEVAEGQELAAGDVLGAIGTPGGAEALEGQHLHFEVLLDGKPVDPQTLLQ